MGGIWLVSIGARDAWKAWQSSSWPATTGTIITSTIRVSHGRHGSSYTPQIAYTYSVNGASYNGASITPGRVWNSSAAYAAVREFPAGSHPQIYYSPANPHQAVLMPGLHFSNMAYVIIGLIPLTLAGTIGSIGLIARIYGIPPNPDGSYTLNNNTQGCVVFGAGFVAFAVEIGLMFWMGR